MAAPKGHKKAGGRQKGVENKITKEAREIFVQTLEGEVPYIKDAFASVRDSDPAKYLELFAKYAQYFVPKKLQVDGSQFAIIPQMTQTDVKQLNGKFDTEY
jgi:hypothetical protein